MLAFRRPFASPAGAARWLLAAWAAGAASFALPEPARAFDLFGLFGSEPEPPAPSPTALPYAARVTGTDDSDVLTAVQDASVLYRLRQEAPPDGEGLVRRAEADLAKLTDVLSGYGYYQGRVEIRIDGVSVATGRTEAAVRAAEAWRNRGLVPVKLAVELGPLYTLRRIAVRDGAGRPFPEETVPPRLTRVGDDVPARSATVLAREAAIVDRFRAQGHPFAKVVSRDPVVDDSAHVMDVTFSVAPGPVAGIGAVSVSGAEGIDPARSAPSSTRSRATRTRRNRSPRSAARSHGSRASARCGSARARCSTPTATCRCSSR